MVDRALSEPPQLHGSAGVNPFWSEKNQKEVQTVGGQTKRIAGVGTVPWDGGVASP